MQEFALTPGATSEVVGVVFLIESNVETSVRCVGHPELVLLLHPKNVEDLKLLSIRFTMRCSR